MRNPADFRGHVSRGECDAELMAVASMFVAEVIEMAKVEAARRRKSGAYATQQLSQQQMQLQQQHQMQLQQQQQQPLDDRSQQPVPLPASAQRLRVAYGSLKERLTSACGSLAERLRGLRSAYRPPGRAAGAAGASGASGAAPPP